MTLRRMRRKMRRTISFIRQDMGYLKNKPYPFPDDMPIKEIFGSRSHDETLLQTFAVWIELRFDINITDAEAEELMSGTIEKATPWIRERMKNPVEIFGGVATPKKPKAA